jgi:hypothetical protein
VYIVLSRCSERSRRDRCTPIGVASGHEKLKGRLDLSLRVA